MCCLAALWTAPALHLTGLKLSSVGRPHEIICCLAALQIAPALQLMGLKHQTLVDRLTHLQQLLQLTGPQVTQFVHKHPPLLTYAPAKLSQAYSSLADLLGGQQQARALVLHQPKVCCALLLGARVRAATSCCATTMHTSSALPCAAEG